jgi:hypothetical protein
MTLEGENTARDEGVHDIVWCNLIKLAKLPDKPNDLVCLRVGLLRIEKPVNSGGFAGNVSRQVDKIGGSGVLHIEKCPLPLPAGF